jgi:hypothetical protein
VKYGPFGYALWAMTVGSSGESTGAGGIAIDDFNGIYVTGFFGTHAEFGNTTLTSSGSADAFLAKIVNFYNVSVTTPGGGTVVVNPPTGSFAENSFVTLTAVPAAGWSFLGWFGDASGSSPTTNLIVSWNKCVEALFGTPVSTSAAGGGTVSITPATTLFPYGSVVRLVATPQPARYFSIWGGSASGNMNPLYFTVSDSIPAISSLFGPLPDNQVSLTVAPDGGGGVTVSPPGNSYPAGQQVTLTAAPDPGQTFLGWNGDASGTHSPLTITLNQSKSIAAKFTSRPVLNLAPCTDGLRPEGFRLSLSGDLARAYRFQVSTNFETWEVLETITNTIGRVQFTDPAATNSAARFYRAELVQ